MANKKNSKYEKPGGMKKGRIGVGIFIVAAVIADTVMIRGYMNGGKSATLGAMIILMTIVYLTVAVSLIRLIIRMEKQMAADGVSRMLNIEQIDRGYEQIDLRLNQLGANIVRAVE